jgi:hypothetical protein
MTIRIRTTGATYPRIVDTSPTLPRLVDTSATLPRLEPSEVAAALGAEPCAEGLEGALGPITLFALRQELFQRLQSSGGRPGLSGTTRRAKIPLSDQQWLQLEELAAAVSSPGFAPSAGQVASVLLTLSLEAVGSRVAQAGTGASGSPLVRQLAARTAAETRRGT